MVVIDLAKCRKFLASDKVIECGTPADDFTAGPTTGQQCDAQEDPQGEGPSVRIRRGVVSAVVAAFGRDAGPDQVEVAAAVQAFKAVFEVAEVKSQRL